ncbi:hypothetical protein ACO0K0_15240 [Undibacterium sp. SXout11W]|uniref:hypothetical protein n=1 Tax=Undibacterium sp. SXout11W TaxID=3413050 RepID=UPI003BEF9AF1
MSVSPLSPLTPAAPSVAIEQVSGVTLNSSQAEQANTVNTADDGDSIVELSNLALLQNAQQLAIQSQIATLDAAQKNAIKHLENLATSTIANNNHTIEESQAQTTPTASEALLNAELQTTLNNEAFIEAIHIESATSALSDAISNANITPSTIPTNPAVTPSTPSSPTTPLNPTTNVTQPTQTQATPITVQPLVDHAATAMTSQMDYATETGSNPAVAAAIAAYQLSNGMIKDASKTSKKIKHDEDAVKGVTLLDTTEIIKDNDAEQKAKRDIPWIWKRVLRIKKKFIEA